MASRSQSSTTNAWTSSSNPKARNPPGRQPKEIPNSVLHAPVEMRAAIRRKQNREVRFPQLHRSSQSQSRLFAAGTNQTLEFLFLFFRPPSGVETVRSASRRFCKQKSSQMMPSSLSSSSGCTSSKEHYKNNKKEASKRRSFALRGRRRP